MEPKFRLPSNQVTKILALISIFLSLTVASVSSLMLHRAIQLKVSPTRKTAEDLLSQVNVFFGGLIGRYDLDIIFRILISCSATALAGGILQFLMSFWLLTAAVQKNRKMTLIWLVAHIAILAAVGGSFLCILTTELQVTIATRAFLPVAGIDSLLIILLCYVISTLGQRERGGVGLRNQIVERQSAREKAPPVEKGRKESMLYAMNVGVEERNTGRRGERVRFHTSRPVPEKPSTPPRQTIAEGRSPNESRSSIGSGEYAKTNWSKDVSFPVPKRDTVALGVTRETDF